MRVHALKDGAAKRQHVGGEDEQVGGLTQYVQRGLYFTIPLVKAQWLTGESGKKPPVAVRPLERSRYHLFSSLLSLLGLS